ncbi:hypothetical protein F2Q69_00013056 [Brassica cretica]|uniref:Uncharacterized protein n=1 Tax=Brassica cretica TaxID=69181 RepID=A0A8S9QG26_BRACR|nr:hypothetical protein F2Q69_00013056 [Brassica cretica]
MGSDSSNKSGRYMPSSTRSNKETQLLFSPDPASLERSIRREAHSSSTDNTHLPSTNILHPISINTPSQTSIDTEPRDMVAPLILVRDNNGDLHDQERHLRNAADTSSVNRYSLTTVDRNTHLPSTNILHLTSINTPSQTSIDTEPRDMVAPLILVRDNNGDLHDQDGHLRNVAVVKEEKLQEGDFAAECLMSFGGSQWCRSTPDLEHRSTYTSPYRSTYTSPHRFTGPPEHRSTTPTESTASCNAVKILTHEEFAAKHPHSPCPDKVKIAPRADTSIDRHRESSIDRYSEASIDRQPSAPID